MKSISLDELKTLQVEMLKKVADYCESNNLTYFLAYGTLLGAVRHKGYIPWDDDIDIMMPRSDYDLFLKNFNGQVPSLRVNAPELDPDFYAPYANVYDERTVLEEDIVSHKTSPLGIKIDIFPLDWIPQDEGLYDELWRRSKVDTVRLFSKTKLLSYCHGMDWIKLLVRKIQYLTYSVRKIQIRHLELINDEKYRSDGPLMDVVAITWRFKMPLDKSCYYPAARLSFEGYEFMAPKEYDTVLRTIYGDYMKLPPENERVPRHSFRAYWK